MSWGGGRAFRERHFFLEIGFYIHIFIKFTLQHLPRHPRKKLKLQHSPRKHIFPVILVAGDRSILQLEADPLPDDGTIQFLVATLSSLLNASTHHTHVERSGFRWPSAITSPEDQRSNASRSSRNSESSDDRRTRRGTKPPKQVVHKNQPYFSVW
jgi:hypothetical protein